MQKKFMRLPIVFSEVKNSNFDSSIIPVDIKVMHDGLNSNNSTFFEKAINDASNSLKNKPILGYVQKVDGSNSKDFKGHEIEISFDEGKTKLVYLERPLGVIPETNQYSIMEEDGKKFVFCRGYLWKEYMNDAYEVLQDSPTKSVSMEIAVDDYDVNEDGSINIKKYRYLGVTILGDNTRPAMDGAKLSVVGDLPNKFSTDFYEKIEELNSIISNFTSEENKPVETEEVVEETVETTEEVKADEEFENADKTDDTENTNDKTDDKTVDEDETQEEIQPVEYSHLEMAYDILKEKFEELEANFNQAKAENETLQNRVSEYEKAEKQEQLDSLYAEFSELDEEELNSVKEKAINMSVEEIEIILFAMLGRKQKQISFSKKATSDVVRVQTEEKDIDEPYGSLGKYIKK